LANNYNSIGISYLVLI